MILTESCELKGHGGNLRDVLLDRLVPPLTSIDDDDGENSHRCGRCSSEATKAEDFFLPDLNSTEHSSSSEGSESTYEEVTDKLHEMSLSSCRPTDNNDEEEPKNSFRVSSSDPDGTQIKNASKAMIPPPPISSPTPSKGISQNRLIQSPRMRLMEASSDNQESSVVEEEPSSSSPRTFIRRKKMVIKRRKKNKKSSEKKPSKKKTVSFADDAFLVTHVNGNRTKAHEFVPSPPSLKKCTKKRTLQKSKKWLLRDELIQIQNECRSLVREIDEQATCYGSPYISRDASAQEARGLEQFLASARTARKVTRSRILAKLASLQDENMPAVLIAKTVRDMSRTSVQEALDRGQADAMEAATPSERTRKEAHPPQEDMMRRLQQTLERHRRKSSIRVVA